MSDVGVKLSGDNSEFFAMMRGAVDNAGKFSGELAGKVAGNFGNLNKIGNALGTALGLNFQNIAEQAARIFTGMSKEAEEAYKSILENSARIADLDKQTAQLRLTEEQKYTLMLGERDKLQRNLNNLKVAEVETIEDILLTEGLLSNVKKANVSEEKILAERKELSRKISELSLELAKQEKKVSEEQAKRIAEVYKAKQEGYEKEYQGQISLLSTGAQIEKLKNGIASIEAAILLQLVSQKDAELLAVALKERKNLLVAAQVKYEKEVGEIVKKNNEAEADAADKRIEIAREDRTLGEQKEELLQNLATVQRDIVSGLDMEFDVTKEIKRETELKSKLKDIEKKQNEANVEISKLLLKGEANLTSEEKLKLQVLQGQTSQKKIQDEINAILARSTNGISDVDKVRLATLVGQSSELSEQIAKLAEMNALAKEFVLTIGRSGTSYEGQSTASLEGVRDKIRKQLFDVSSANAMATPNNRNPIEIALRSELDQISRELSARTNIANFANANTEEEARRKYGDTLTDRALRSVQDEVTKQRVTMDQFLELFKKSVASTPK